MNGIQPQQGLHTATKAVPSGSAMSNYTPAGDEYTLSDLDMKPVFIAQLNLIPGGLILALGFNHVATDAGGKNLATAMICECSKAYIESRLLHPVDLRIRSGERVSRNYFGNAVTVASAGPVQIADLLGPNGLSIAVTSIRQSIENTTLASIANATALVTMMGPTEKLVFRPSGGLLEQNLMVTTWYSNRTETYNFGIGPPSAVRTWAALVRGFAILFLDCKRRKDSRL
ncbi:hypothetical protein BDR22DRAFT_893795 [Usnea florida]